MTLAFSIFSFITWLWFWVEVSASFSYFTAGTSIKISIRSIKGPDSFLLYIETCEGEQMQAFSGLFKNPQGQGLLAPTSINRLGNVRVFLAREIVILPSSIGCLSDSNTSR